MDVGGGVGVPYELLLDYGITRCLSSVGVDIVVSASMYKYLNVKIFLCTLCVPIFGPNYLLML